jgi:hypothetical protein
VNIYQNYELFYNNVCSHVGVSACSDAEANIYHIIDKKNQDLCQRHYHGRQPVICPDNTTLIGASILEDSQIDVQLTQILTAPVLWNTVRSLSR